MSEEPPLSSLINVRKLISIYEKKSDPPKKTSALRNRAKSLGDLLNEAVTVKYNDFNTFYDVRKALENVEKNLNIYLVYDKKKHVNFQEKLFNILTGVIGIKIDENEENEKRELIAKTQAFLAFLNQKLPNNRIKSKNDDDDDAFENEDEEEKEQNLKSVVKVKPVTQKNSADEVDSKVDKTKKSHAVSNSIAVNEELPTTEVSVSKLRNLFEEKSKSPGLQSILDAPRTFQYDVKIPYTESNLQRYRLYRANSGHYLNFTGLIQSVDVKRIDKPEGTTITRSKSLKGLNYDKKFNNDSDLSDDEDSSGGASVESVKEIKNFNPLSSIQQVRLGQGQIMARTVDVEENHAQNAQYVLYDNGHESVQYSTLIDNNNTEELKIEEMNHVDITPPVENSDVYTFKENDTDEEESLKAKGTSHVDTPQVQNSNEVFVFKENDTEEEEPLETKENTPQVQNSELFVVKEDDTDEKESLKIEEITPRVEHSELFVSKENYTAEEEPLEAKEYIPQVQNSELFIVKEDDTDEEESLSKETTPQVEYDTDEEESLKSEETTPQVEYSDEAFVLKSNKILEDTTNFIENERQDSSNSNGYDSSLRLSLDEEQLKNAEEEFEKLVQNNKI